MPQKLLTVKETASILHIHPHTLRRWQKQGLLKSYSLGPRHSLRFEREDILDFLNNSQNEAHKTKKQLIEEIESLLQEDERGIELERKYSFLFDEGHPLNISIDMDRKIIDLNELALESLGFERKELLGKDILEFIAPQEREKVAREFDLDLQGKKTPTVENNFICHTGIRTFLFAEDAVMLFENNRPVGASFNIFDITERKRAEEELGRNNELKRLAMESSPNRLFFKNTNLTYVFCNPSYAADLSIKPDDIYGKTDYDFFPPDLANKYRADDHRIMTSGHFEQMEEKYRIGAEERTVLTTKTPIRDTQGNTIGILGVFTDITEHKQAEEQLQHSFINLAETVSHAMASRDPYTPTHQHRVAQLTRLVGQKLKLDKDRLMGLYIGSLLHDIGKVSIPAIILSKPGELSPEEWQLIRAHTKEGYNILKDTDLPWPVADMALHHHERLDGSGYPNGISGDKLSLENRILGLCDVVEAMSSHRPYRPARTKPEIIKEIKRGRGTGYDAHVADIILGIIESGEFDFACEHK